MRAKPLFLKLPVYSIGLTMLGIMKNVKVFSEKMKILFHQKGYVSTGLNAKITVNRVPISFSC
jgi:hypothetical protein